MDGIPNWDREMMDSVGEKGSRLLDDAAQLYDLLRMASSMAHRMQQDLHGNSYVKVSELVNQLHDLRVMCNALFDEVARDVEQMDSGEFEFPSRSDRQQ